VKAQMLIQFDRGFRQRIAAPNANATACLQ
jgi:hypothetical protein